MKKTYILAAILTLLSFPAFATVDRIDPNAMEVNGTALGTLLDTFPTTNLSVSSDISITTSSMPSSTADWNGRTVVCKYIGGCSLNLAAATVTGYRQGFGTRFDNLSGEDFNITSTSFIGGSKTLNVKQGYGCEIRSDGTNYLKSEAACRTLAYEPMFDTGDMTAIDSRFTLTNTSTGVCTYINSSGDLAYTLAGQCGGRVDYTTAGVLIGPAAEPERTNLAKWSNAGDDGAFWGPLRATTTPNAGESPDGTNNANLFAETATTGSHLLTEPNFSIIYQNNKPYTHCVSVKPATDTYYQLTFPSTAFGSGQYVNFKGDDCTVATAVGGVGRSYLASNGFCRSCITAQSTAGTSAAPAVLALIDNNPAATRTPSYLGVDGSVYWFGMQTEQADGPSSYIPTTTAIVTRKADDLTLTNPYLVGQKEGAVCLDYTTRYDAAGMRVLSDTAADRSLLYYATATDIGSKDGTNTVTYGGAFNTAQTENSICITYGKGKSNVSNSGTLLTEQNFDGNWGLAGLKIGAGYDGTNRASMWLKRLRLFHVQPSTYDLNVMTQ